MLRETVLDLRNVVREMPWFGAAVLLSIAIGVGAEASFFAEADGNSLRLGAGRVDKMSCFDGAMRRLSHRSADERIPGFTVILAMRQYSVELSVPMRPLLDDAGAGQRGGLNVVDLRQAA